MIPLVSYMLLLLSLLLALIVLYRWPSVAKRRNTRKPGRGRLETDLRLTYKRFKELYPHSKITYREYKKLQKEKAYKRAVSSQKIKRMVR